MERRLRRRFLDQSEPCVVMENGRRNYYEPFSKTLYTCHLRDVFPRHVCSFEIADVDIAGKTLHGIFYDDMTPVVFPVQRRSSGYWLRLKWYVMDYYTHIHYPSMDLLRYDGHRFKNRVLNPSFASVAGLDIVMDSLPTKTEASHLMAVPSTDGERRPHMAMRRALRSLFG